MLLSTQKRNMSFDPEVSGMLAGFNLQRIPLVSLLILLFQLANLLGSRFFSSPAYLAGFILFSATSIIYFVFLKWFYHKKTLKKSTWIYMSFWLLICAGSIAYLVGDLTTIKIPINFVLCASLLIAAPILTLWQSILLYSLFTLSGMVVAVCCRVDFSIYFLIVAASISGFALSHMIQKQYITLITRLNQETNTDFLTGILNRKGGIEKMHLLLSVCKRQKRPMVTYMIDIDHFKDYNDTYGHVAGDEVLKKISSCVRRVFSRSSDIVCRYGGEEFLVCFPVDSNRNFQKMAELLRISIIELKIPSARKEISPYVTVSIGVSLYDPDKDNVYLDEMPMIEQADIALYRAKDNGRNQIVYYQANMRLSPLDFPS